MEAAEVFNEQNTLFVGVGKVNATYELTKAIHQKKPDLIVNLGSAGSSAFKKGDVVCCTQFVQRDMDVSGLGYERYVTPYTNIPSVLQYGLQMEPFPLGICGTGDNFEMGHTETKYDVVDMEAYAIATIAMKEKIPFLCLKYISDGADDNAAEDWPVLVHKAALAFGEIFQIG
ncbi:nucleosidase [Flavobacterium sp. L1I52]|uniref:Nucleosidase n=2 Tax=Flavobacterium pokkalii TaxID=1940408 RepID=A0ABR7UVK3_9FLAO|nr:nucleosidase [Flavobacterium pokkalii]